MRNSIRLLVTLIVTLFGCGDLLGQKCVSPPSGMVAWLTFDSSTNGNTPNLISPQFPALIKNGRALASGKVLKGIEFNSAVDVVEVQDHPSVNFGEGNFTIDAWTKLREAQTGNAVWLIADKRGAPVGHGYMFYVYRNRLALQLNAPPQGFGNYLASTATPALKVGEWQHVAVTVDRKSATGITFYVNGSETGTADPTGRKGNLDSPGLLRIGADPRGGSQYFRGAIDEVELFNRVLSREEIMSIYKADAAGKCKSTAK